MQGCLALFCIFMLASCESSTTPPSKPITVVPSDRTLFVLNEGQFLHSNSSLDAILFHHDSTKIDTIDNSSVLNKMGEGNDLIVIGHRAIIVDNSSNVINILDADSLRQVATIPMGLDAPNQIAVINSTTLLVTRRNTTSAAIVDLTTNAITDSIKLGEVSIAAAVLNGKAYITTSAAQYSGPYHLQIVNLSTHAVTKTMELPQSPEQAIADSANNDVIIGTSPIDTVHSPIFYFISASTDNVLDSLTTPKGDPEITRGSKHFIVNGNVIFPLSGPTHTMPAPLLTAATWYYKGMYDATTDALYLGNAGDYQSPGNIDVYSAATGKLLWTRPAGIAPAHFAFYH